MNTRTQIWFGAYRRWWIGAAVLCCAALALVPTPSFACDWTDVPCHRDAAFYDVQQSVTELLWTLAKGMLSLARVIEGFRDWLITDVLGTVLDGVLRGLEGPFVLAVTAALLLFWFSFFVQSFVALNWIDLRKAVRNGLLALFIFFYGAELAATAEASRVTLSAMLGEVAAQSVTTAATSSVQTFSGPPQRTEVVADPTAIYADDPCGVNAARPDGVLMLNDLAANYLFATAEDIHCANPVENEPNLPYDFWEEGTYLDGTSTPGYFSEREIGEMDQEPERRGVINTARDGLTRMSFGVPLALTALLEQVLQLLYALALMAVWFGLSVSTIFSLFLPTEKGFTEMIDALITTIRSSMLAALWVGIGAATLQVAISASNSNGLIVACFGVLVLVLMIWLILKAAALFVSTLGTVSGATLANVPTVMAGAGVAALGVGAALGTMKVARSLRHDKAYWQSYEGFVNDYGDDTAAQREAADTYAEDHASNAVKTTVGRDLQQVVRGGVMAGALVKRPTHTALHLLGRHQAARKPEPGAGGPGVPTTAIVDGTPTQQMGATLARNPGSTEARDQLRYLRTLATQAQAQDGMTHGADALLAVDLDLADLHDQHDRVQDTLAGSLSAQNRAVQHKQMRDLDAQIRSKTALRADLDRLRRHTPSRSVV